MYLIRSLIPYSKTSQQWTQIVIIFAACLSGVALGTHFSWTSPSIPILISNTSHLEPITLEAASYFTVIPPIAMLISAPLFVEMVERLGRKKTVVLISVPYILSWLLTIFAKNLLTFYASRFIEGMGEAMFFAAVPIFICEITVPSVRGTWGNLLSLGIYFGEFLVNLVGNICNIRTTAYILISIPILQLLTGMCLPESPYFLIKQGRLEEAQKCLQILHWKKDVSDELQILTMDVNRQISESGSWKDLFIISSNNRALKIAIGLRLAQLFSGLAAFTLYTKYIFDQAGGDLSASTCTLIFTGTFVILISISSMTADKLGRRPSMILSSSGCCIATTIEAIYFYISEKTNYDLTQFGWVPISGMVFYLIACAAGFAILPTLMLGELFSASVKSKAVCVTNASYSIGILVSSKLFQTLSVNFGMYVPFVFYSICSFISILFSCLYVPETKGRSLEEIQGFLK